jgi:hypothetical protein
MLDIAPAVLDREFGRETMRRARAYASSGHVLSHHIETDGPSIDLRGTVSGSAAAPYRARVRIEPMRAGVEIWATCTCPVQLNCKHAAALLVVAQLSTASAPAQWIGGLSEALAALEREARPPEPRSALGLRFEVSLATYRWSDQTVRSLGLRPLRVGKLGRWITTGCNWKDVPGLAWDNSVDPEQVAALARLQVAMGTSYGGSPDLLNAAASFWPALRQLLDSGVELVPGPGVREVTVRDRPLAVTADLREDDDGLRVDFRVGDDDDSLPLADAELIGTRPHGVLLLEPVEPSAPRARPEFALTLAPLRQRLPEQVRHYLRRTTSVHVPDSARAEFEDDFLPRLRRRLPTTSRDGSVRLVEQAPPRLLLELDWTALGALTVRAFWTYAGRGRRQRFGIDSADGILTVRQPELEAAVLASLKLPTSAAGLLCDTAGRLRGETRLSAEDLLAFVDDALVPLRASTEFELSDLGEPIDYRLATGEPEISFRADEETSSEHTDWLDLEVLVRVDGHQVPLGMILTALTRNAKMIALPGGLHVRTDHPTLQRLAELVAAAEELVEQEEGRLRVGRHDVGLWGEADELGVVDEVAQAWVHSARALQHFDGLPELDPTALTSTLRNYQEQGARWLLFLWQAGLGGVLADDMGLGKTLQTLAVIAHARARGAGPFLVVAPTSVVSNWGLEAARHAPGLSVGLVTSTKSRRDKSIADLAGT